MYDRAEKAPEGLLTEPRAAGSLGFADAGARTLAQRILTLSIYAGRLLVSDCNTKQDVAVRLERDRDTLSQERLGGALLDQVLIVLRQTYGPIE